MLEINVKLPTNSLEHIVIEDKKRWRQDIDEKGVEELAESIDKLGLLHAIVVRNDGKTLVAGRRRFEAISLLAQQGKRIRYNDHLIPIGKLPIIKMEDLTIREYKEAEYDENIRRKNFSWQEQAHAVSELHHLLKEEAEEEGKKHHKQDTAKELADDPEDKKSVVRSYGEVKEDLLVAAYIDDPEVAAAPNRKEAIKIIRRKLEVEHRQALAKEFDMDKLRTPHKALHGDLLDILPKLPAHTYDCIIADPPYGIEADKFKNQEAVQHSYDDSEEYSNKIITCIANEGMRITKFKAHAYIFCDINRFRDVKEIFEHYGWYVWNTPLIWSKGPNVGVAPRPEHGPRRTYEAIVYCIKNDRRVNAVWPDAIHEPHDKSVQYGAHKPPGLYSNLIKRSCFPGDKVIDPCCGTGPVFVAAEENKVVATGIELGEEGFGYSVVRIRGLEE
jgi:ParB-like chromosome segregation protein Spo0J